VARSWQLNCGQGLLGRATAPDTSVRLGVPAQRPALCERRPRQFSSSFNSLEEKKGRTDGPMARRPVRRRASTNARVRRRPASHRRQAINRSPVVLPPRNGGTYKAQRPPLGVLVFWWLWRGWSGGICVYLRYLRFEMGWRAALRYFCDALVSWWFFYMNGRFC